MGIKMYNKEVCQSPQQIAKNWEIIISSTPQSDFKWKPFKAALTLMWIRKLFQRYPF